MAISIEVDLTSGTEISQFASSSPGIISVSIYLVAIWVHSFVLFHFIEYNRRLDQARLGYAAEKRRPITHP